MTTAQKLAAYKLSLEKWRRLRDTFNRQEKENKKHSKPLESEPSMMQFEIASNDAWANKIRDLVLGIEKPAIKIPTRKTVIKIPTRRTI